MNTTLSKSKDDCKTQIETIYSNQFSLLYSPSLLNIISHGYHERIPLLMFLNDLYRTTAITHYYQNQPLLTEKKWIKNSSHVTQLSKYNIQKEEIKEVLIMFNKRIGPLISVKPPFKIIDDDITEYVEYVNDMTKLIKNMLNQQNITTTPPFQIDLTIIPSNIEKIDDDDDDDDDDASDSESDDDAYDEPNNDQIFNAYDTIQSRLERNEMYVSCQLNEQINTNRESFFVKLVNALKEKITNPNFPSNTRICITIDRHQKNLYDTIYAYVPKKYNKITNNCIAEYFIQTSCKYMLCGCPVNNDDIKAKTIGANHFILSFHVESIDEIRCYLYFNGQHTRFLPKHIIELWPSLFNMKKCSNKHFIPIDVNKDYLTTDTIRRMNLRLTDRKFNNFINI